MQLNDYIAAYMPQSHRGLRDYESGAGWYHQVNLLLKKLERLGLYKVTKQKERVVEVDNDYWITLPSDCRDLIKIYDPFHPSDVYKYQYLNSKIKLSKSFTKDDSPDEFTLSAGSTTTIKINDADATADLWNEYALFLTNGTYSGDGIIIHDTAAAAAGTSVLTFRHTQPGTIDSTTGYLTNDYMVLVYKATFTMMSAYNGEIPIDDKYEGDLLLKWLELSAVAKTDKKYPIYKNEFQEVLDEVIEEQNTPDLDNIRPAARPWPEVDFDLSNDYDQYVQDEPWDYYE